MTSSFFVVPKHSYCMLAFKLEMLSAEKDSRSAGCERFRIAHRRATQHDLGRFATFVSNRSLSRPRKATLAAWLSAHRKVQVVSRDRTRTYTEAIRGAAPKALQVADRFHLSQNLEETLERMMHRFYPTIKQIFGETNAETQSADHTALATT